MTIDEETVETTQKSEHDESGRYAKRDAVGETVEVGTKRRESLEKSRHETVEKVEERRNENHHRSHEKVVVAEIDYRETAREKVATS